MTCTFSGGRRCGPAAANRRFSILRIKGAPNPRDEFILELAVASASQAVVTHNVRDFRGAEMFGVRIVTPAAFLRLIEEEP